MYVCMCLCMYVCMYVSIDQAAVFELSCTAEVRFGFEKL